MFDTYSDWVVVFNFRDEGFNNPLLPHNIHWLRAWFLFASIGTFLTAISVLHDAIDLLYSAYKSCQKHCCKSSSKGQYRATNPMVKQQSFEMKDKNPKKGKVDKDEEDDDDIDDPCKCCYRCGWNGTTRNETLGAITLWFQDVPMLTIAILYAFSQTTCKTPDPRDVTPFLQDIGISATAAVAASLWRLLRSFARLCSSVSVRMETDCCSKKCFPKKSEAAYPPDTCAQCCIIPFYVGLIFQCFLIFAGALITGVIWAQFVQLKGGKNFDDSLGIYRFSPLNPPDHLLFNISGNIIPPNGTFVNLERIPDRILFFDGELFCLSEFEYREEDSQIYFNAGQVKLVSEDSQFCTITSGLTEANTCLSYYSLENFILYYASINPTTGELERFDDACVVVRDTFDYFAVPEIDPSINLDRHINRTAFPVNEPLVIFYPEARVYFGVSSIVSAPGGQFTDMLVTQDPVTMETVRCAEKFEYALGQVFFSYWEVFDYQQPQCFCRAANSRCPQFYQNLLYAHLTSDNVVVPYTNCSGIPRESLRPYFDFNIDVPCPC